MSRLLDRVVANVQRRFVKARGSTPALAECHAETVVPFCCNLCGVDNEVRFAQLQRETPSCRRCGSTVRFRAIGQLVARELFGADIALPDLPRRRDVLGLGLSDADAYAQPLAARLTYENTFFHRQPRVDITAIEAERMGRYDFVIASDVFEHVAAPVARAFVNARRLLRPGGALILTVPFTLAAATREHFPVLADWRIEGESDARVLVNRTADGHEERFGQLCFHGGDGSTLEMRLFCRDGLLAELAAAGFVDVHIAADAYLPFGIVWPEPWSVPIVARAPA